MARNQFNAPTIVHVFDLVETGTFDVIQQIKIEQVCARKDAIANLKACYKDLKEKYEDFTQFIVYIYSTDAYGVQIEGMSGERLLERELI